MRTFADKDVGLLRDALPSLPISHVSLNDEGWACRVVEINHEWIFRFPRTPNDARHADRALRFYPFLKGVVPLPIPSNRIVSRSPGGRVRFVGYPRLPGRGLPSEGLGGDRGRAWASDISRLLTTLDKVSTTEAVNSGIPSIGPVEDRKHWWKRYKSFSRLVRDRLSPEELRRDQESSLAALEDARFFRVKRTLGHGDLFPSHILVGPGRSGITGIIDWEDASIHDPASSLACLPLGFAHMVLELWRPGDEGLWYRSRVRAHWIVGGDLIHWHKKREDARFGSAMRQYARTIP